MNGRNLNPESRRIRSEIRHHIDELEAHLVDEGMTPEDAKREAARRFGDPEHIAAETEGSDRRQRPTARLRNALDILRQDTRFALRQLRRQPLVTFLTVATLVTGVAATAVVFSLVNAVVLAPLPFADPERVVVVNQVSPQGRLYGVSEPNLLDFQARATSFEAMAGLGFNSTVLQIDGEAQAINGMTVNHSFFPLLGIEPIAGRGFTEAEDTFNGAIDVVLLSETTWQQRFGGDPSVVGTTLLLDGVLKRVVGVVPSDHAWPEAEVFTPLALNPDAWRDDQRLEAVARLRPGVSLADANREMSAIAADLSDEYPESNDQWGADVQTAKEWLIGPRLTRLGGFLLGAVGLFLLMACASVSNLLLARATARLDEMSVRAAMGAARGRIASQLFTESVLLAVVGTGLALALAPLALGVIRAIGPSDIARLHDVSLNGPALGVAVAAALLTIFLAGLAPGALLVRSGTFTALRSGKRGGAGPGAHLRSGLILTQFALAVTVLLGAGLLTRSFVSLQQVDFGFEARSIARFAVRLPDEQYTQDQRLDFLTQLEAELMALPGVVAVGATHAPPFSRWAPGNFVARSDREPDRQQDFLPVSWRAVSDNYFEAAGIPLLAGRTFGPEDRLDPGEEVLNPPVIIDRELALQLWPDGEDPIGKLVTWFLPGGWQCVVVGVVGTTRDERVDRLPRPRIYRTLAFTNWAQPSVLVKTAGDPGALIPGIRRTVAAHNASVPAISPDLVSNDIASSVAWPRFSMQVLSAFALIALVLASMGIYGVTAFAVSQRRREIGVRVALGAEPSGVRWMVVRKATGLAVLGILGGLGLSVLVTGFLETLLYDVSSTDPATFVAVPLILLLVAVASAWIPARRALGVSPQEALRAE